MMFLSILIILGLVYYVVRMYLENDAMIKARYLAKEYLDESEYTTKEENEKLVSEFDKINNKLDSMDCKIKIFVGNLKDTSSWIDNSGDKDE